MDQQTTYNMHEAKTHLSKLVAQAKAGEEVILSKAGIPEAMIVPIPPEKKLKKRRKPGALKGKIKYADDWDSPETNEMIARMFYDSLGVDMDSIPLTGKMDEIPS